MADVPDRLRKKALAAAWAVQQVGSQAWNDYCERFAENAFGTQGRYPSALAGGNALPLQREIKNAKVGDLVYFSADDTNNGYGHVGIYVGNGEMVSATPTGVKRTGILTDTYYAPRFRGVAEAPADWQGRMETPDLAKGAEALIGRATGAPSTTAMTAGPMQQGAGTVAGEQPRANQAEIDTYTAQVDEAQKRLQDAQDKIALIALVQEYRNARVTNPRDPNDPNRDANWLPAHGLTKAQMDDAIASYEQLIPAGAVAADPSTAIKVVSQFRADAKEAQNDLDRAKTALGKAQTVEPPSRAQQPSQVSAPTSQRYILQQQPDGTIHQIENPNYEAPAGAKPAAPSTFQGADGRQYVLSEDRRTATLVAGQPEPEGKKTQFQVVKDPATGDTWTYDPEKGAVVTKLFGGNELDLEEQKSKVEQAKLKLQILNSAREELMAVRVQPPSPERNKALYDLGEKYAMMLDPIEGTRLAMEYATKVADQNLRQADSLSKQTGQQYDPFTLQPKLNPDGTPMLTADEANRRATFGETQRATNLRTASEAATEGMRAEAERRKTYLPAEAAAGLQPLYEAFASGKAPVGLGPTLLPKQESLGDVRERIFNATMQALAPHSPLASQWMQQSPAPAGPAAPASPPPGPAGPTPVPAAWTVNTMGGPPNQAAMLNTATMGVVNASGQAPAPLQEAAPPAPPPPAPPAPPVLTPLQQLLQQYETSLGRRGGV